jgi:hypothetical protein
VIEQEGRTSWALEHIGHIIYLEALNSWGPPARGAIAWGEGWGGSSMATVDRLSLLTPSAPAKTGRHMWAPDSVRSCCSRGPRASQAMSDELRSGLEAAAIVGPVCLPDRLSVPLPCQTA